MHYHFHEIVSSRTDSIIQICIFEWRQMYNHYTPSPTVSVLYWVVLVYSLDRVLTTDQSNASRGIVNSLDSGQWTIIFWNLDLQSWKYNITN